MNRLTDRTKTTGRLLRSPQRSLSCVPRLAGCRPSRRSRSPPRPMARWSSSGQTLTVSVAASGDTFQAVQLTGNAAMNGIYTLTAPPYEFAIPIPPDADSRI